MDRNTVIIGVISALVFAGIIGSAIYGQKNFEPRNQCVQHSVSLSMHIHPELEIYDGDQKLAIPAEIGIDPSCMKAVHTHDETGKIHLEYPEQHQFVLEDFFAVWGKPFNKNEILDKKANDTHTVTMTVNGQPNDQFEKLPLEDGQKIVIRYQAK